MAPCIRAQAAIVIDHARTGSRRRAIESVAAFAARYQALHNARRDGAAWRVILVVLKTLCSKRESFFSYDRRYWDSDPLGPGPLVVSAITLCNSAAETDRTCDALALRRLSLVEAGCPFVSRVAQHRPNRRALPTGNSLARRHALLVQQTGDGADA